MVQIFSTARSAVVYVEISRGYGQSVDLLNGEQFIQIGKALYGDNILYIIAMFLSKFSVALLCQRLSPRRDIGMVIWGTMGGLALFALVSILLVTIRCNPLHPWIDLAAQCSSLVCQPSIHSNCHQKLTSIDCSMGCHFHI